ncbi:MAG: response regulator [Anaerolinea sp.]|nr:response regulator [Anaerolinea sp.]
MTQKVLIIDDDPDISLASRLILESAGYAVSEARTSTAGLAAVKAETPDLIILDVMMESATAGFQAALALRNPDPASEYAAYRGIPIIMLTAVHETLPYRVAPDEGYLPVDVFLDKPVDAAKLLPAVQGLLNKQQA